MTTNCNVCGRAIGVCTACDHWGEGVHAEVIRSRATNEYTPGATNGKLQYHARIKARNNQIIFTSEVYVRRRSANRALELLGFGEWEEIDESK